MHKGNTLNLKCFKTFYIEKSIKKITLLKETPCDKLLAEKYRYIKIYSKHIVAGSRS